MLGPQLSGRFQSHSGSVADPASQDDFISGVILENNCLESAFSRKHIPLVSTDTRHHPCSPIGLTAERDSGHMHLLVVNTGRTRFP